MAHLNCIKFLSSPTVIAPCEADIILEHIRFVLSGICPRIKGYNVCDCILTYSAALLSRRDRLEILRDFRLNETYDMWRIHLIQAMWWAYWNIIDKISPIFFMEPLMDQKVPNSNSSSHTKKGPLYT